MVKHNFAELINTLPHNFAFRIIFHSQNLLMFLPKVLPLLPCNYYYNSKNNGKKGGKIDVPVRSKQVSYIHLVEHRVIAFKLETERKQLLDTDSSLKQSLGKNVQPQTWHLPCWCSTSWATKATSYKNCNIPFPLMLQTIWSDSAQLKTNSISSAFPRPFPRVTDLK